MFIDVNFRVTSSAPTEISFAWDAVDGAKYNVFRSLVSNMNEYGAFEKLNDELLETEAFTDSDGLAGRIYIYFMRAIPNFYSEAIDGPYDGSLSNFVQAGFFPATNAGADVVRQIVEAAYARMLAFCGPDWARLPFPRQIEKNPDNLKFGYAALARSAKPGDNQILGSYCLTLELELVFYARVVKNASELDLEAAELALYSWADRAAKDFRKNKLFLPTVVLKVDDHSIAAPEYNPAMTAAALRVTFPIVFRQSISS